LLNLVNGRVLATQPDAVPDLVGLANHVEVSHAGAASVGQQQSGQHPDRRRLARPVRPEQPVQAATDRSRAASASVTPNRLRSPSATIMASPGPRVMISLLSTLYAYMKRSYRTGYAVRN
jgi:hypothetical protein